MQGLPLFASRRRSVFLTICAVAVPLVLLVTMLSQSVFAQNTFVITDGDQVIVHTTHTSDPAVALDEAGVEADPGEYAATISEDGVYDITVDRSDFLTLANCGEYIQIPVEDGTVGDLLDRYSIPTGDGYEVSCDLNTVLTEGMTVQVDHFVTNEETYTVELPFETTVVEDPTLPEGEEQILEEGVAGQVLYTAKVEYCNGKEVARQILSEEPIRQSKAQVVAVGKNAGKPVIDDGVIILPSGEVLTYYKAETFHATAYTMYDEGCDELTSTSTPVKWGVVAVDPRVIPYGTRMYIVTDNGDFIYGVGTAEDCGGAIKGRRVDLFMPTLRQAFAFGRRDVTIYFLGDANWTY